MNDLMSKMHAFILAGGFATRLWPLTERRAKPLLPLAGKPIISHIVDGIPASIDITVSTNAALKDGFFEWIGRHPERKINIAVEQTHDDDRKVGALGALAQWIKEEHIESDVLLLTGDNYFGFRMEDFFAKYRESVPIVAAHDIGDDEQAKAFGTIVLDPETGIVSAFEEKPKHPRSTLVSTGCSILPANVLHVVVEFAEEHPDNVGGIFEEFLRRNIVPDCFVFTQPWFDIGSFNAYLEASRVLAPTTILSSRSAPLENVSCEGCVIIGQGTTVKNSTLKDVVIFDDCLVDDCVLERCVIDNGCRLRKADLSGKMLREGTILERDAIL